MGKLHGPALGQDHVHLTGDVVLSQANSKFYADEVDYYPKTNRVVASGNVLIQEVDHQIAADRADFNALTRLGTFYNARGFASLGAHVDISQFGTLHPDVQFYGDTIEKTGPQTYLITHGGFTTCAQDYGMPSQDNVGRAIPPAAAFQTASADFDAGTKSRLKTQRQAGSPCPHPGRRPIEVQPIWVEGGPVQLQVAVLG